MHSLQVTKTGINVRERERLTSGAQRVFPVRLQFSSDWEELAPKAVFTDGTKNVASAIVDGVVNIPADVLTVGKTVCIQITGFDESGLTVLPTIVAALGAGPVVRGRIDGENEAPPTPELSAQILTAAKNAEQSASAAEEYANNANAAAQENAAETAKMAEYVNGVNGLATRIDNAANRVQENATNAAKSEKNALEASTTAVNAKNEAEKAASSAEEDATRTAIDRKQTHEDRAATEQAREKAETAAASAEKSEQRAAQSAAQAGWVEIVGEDGYLVAYKTDNVNSVDFADNNGILEVVYE